MRKQIPRCSGPTTKVPKTKCRTELTYPDLFCIYPLHPSPFSLPFLLFAAAPHTPSERQCPRPSAPICSTSNGSFSRLDSPCSAFRLPGSINPCMYCTYLLIDLRMLALVPVLSTSCLSTVSTYLTYSSTIYPLSTSLISPSTTSSEHKLILSAAVPGC